MFHLNPSLPPWFVFRQLVRPLRFPIRHPHITVGSIVLLNALPRSVRLTDTGRLRDRLSQTLAESAAAFRKRVYDDPLAVGNVVSPNGKKTSALVLFDPLSDEEFIRLGIEDQIRDAAEQIFAPEELAITGLQTLLVLLVLRSLLFLSIPTGVLALVPNVIAIGIAVDDTIHYLSALNDELRRTGSQEEALLRVGRSVGQPIVYTTLALALVTDLLLVPTLVMSTRIITLWDLLFVKLGPEPHKEIRLFANLRPLNARIVVLMARLEQAEPGTYITRKGDLEEKLYVLLSGQAGVFVDATKTSIRDMGRGDVIGEMGLVRHMPRSADVGPSEPSEYLILDGDFLGRIQRRYPRITAKVFLNLTRILSDRLETSTEKKSSFPKNSARSQPPSERMPC